MATTRSSRGSLGTRRSSKSAADPNSAVLKTTGKTANTPRGSGAQVKAPLNKGAGAGGPAVIGQKGRTVAGTNKTIRSNGQ